MTTESGDNKIIGNFRKLIDEVSAEPDYNPANDKLKIPALEAQYSGGDAVVRSLAASRAPYKLAITDRESAFKALRALVVRSRNFLKASGATRGVVDDAETYVRKLSGARKSAKATVAPGAPEGESPGSSSASQMSYDNQVGNFESYIEILKNVSVYNPNETDLKVTALTALAAGLTAKSNTVNTTTATLNQARGQREPVAVYRRQVDREHGAAREVLRSERVGDEEPVVQENQAAQVFEGGEGKLEVGKDRG